MDRPDGVRERLVGVILQQLTGRTDPLLVALDGRSGAGKSSLAAAVQSELDSCSIVDGDSFYSGGSGESWDARSAQEKAARVIDWRRQRPVLEALARKEAGSWNGYDWQAFDDRLETAPTVCTPADVVIIDGAYSARPELADLLDLRVLLDTTEQTRLERLSEREGDIYRDEWFARWNDAEEHYFSRVMPRSAFDLVL